MNFFELMEKRRSTRAFGEKPVPRELLEQIINAAQTAPCAGAWNAYVICDRETLGKMGKHIVNFMLSFDVPELRARFETPGFDPMYNAPVCILLSGSLDNPMTTQNCAVAAATMSYAATALGVDNVYSAGTAQAVLGDGEWLEEYLELPEDHTVVCGVLLGYRSTDEYVHPWPNDVWGGNKVKFIA